MTTFVILGLVAFGFLIIWYVEPRIFLVLFQRLQFSVQSGKAIQSSEVKQFEECGELERNWKIIQQELNQFISKSRSIPKMNVVDKANLKISSIEGPAWRTIILKAYDGWFSANCSHFPQSTALLKKLSTIETAMFSLLEPGAEITPHSGKFTGVLRYHLALSVPKTGECYLVVNGEKYYWKEGKGVIFNDTYTHSAVNKTDEARVVLLIDLKRPISTPMKNIYQAILYTIRCSPVFRRALKNGKLTTG